MKPALENRPLLKVTALVAFLIAGFWIASFFPDLVLALITSSLLAFILKPLVKFLEFRIGIRRSVSILIVFLSVGGVVTYGLLISIPIALDHAQTFYNQFKNFPFEEKLTDSVRGIATALPFINPNDVSKQVHGFIDGGLHEIGTIAGNAFATAITFVIVPFVTYFILAEEDVAIKSLIARVPNKYFEMTLNVIYKIERDLVGYLRGWILDSMIIGLISMVGYWAIGVQYPILLGSVAGVANLIPYLGPVVGAVPALLVSVTQFGDFRLLLPIIVLAITVQAIDEMVVQPFCFAKAVNMHPLMVILVLIIGNQLMGIMGMILAIPIATIFKVAAAETYWGLKHYRITS